MKSKIRAWDKQDQEMFYPEYLLQDEKDGLLVHTSDARNERYILMQSTGLHDKHKKEIWVGDIIKRPIDVNQEYHGDFCYEEVIEIHGQFIVSHLKSEKGKLPRGYLRGFLLDAFQYDGKLFMWGDDYYPHTEIEVVGNIYENHELLEEAPANAN